MTPNGVLQIAVFFLLILAIAKPLGVVYDARCSRGSGRFCIRCCGRWRRLCYTACGVKETTEQRWTQYAGSLIAFSVFSALILYLLQRLQGWLPLEPHGIRHRARSCRRHADDAGPGFQHRRQLHHQHQLAELFAANRRSAIWCRWLGLTMHNFTSAAAGIAIAIALIRGFARQQANAIGNFWVDMVRATVYVLLPLSLIIALLFCSQGVIQNLHPYTTATTLEGKTQTIAQGPVASQEAIKMLGTNGGGFFNANSAHPFENPTPLTNFVQMLVIFADSRGADLHLRENDRRHAAGLGDVRRHERDVPGGRVRFFTRGAGRQSDSDEAGPECGATANMEGKEVRFGIAASSAVRHGHHRRELRRGEHHARQPDAAGRTGSAVQHADRRSDFRRRGRGTVRHAAVRDPGGVHRRTDGGPHAGISGQEDRSRRKSRWRCSR